MIRVFTSKTQILGEKGEKQAVSYIQDCGYKVVERNVHNIFGEIDIVAKKKGIYHFFEVKAGYKGGFVHPAENLSPAKLRKFLISVEQYVLMHKIKEYQVQGIVVLFGVNGEVEVEMLDLS